MKLRQLVESETVLETLLKKSLPINVAWELKTFIKVINPELTSFVEVKNDKIKELGEEVMENGKPTGSIKVKGENVQEFTKCINELLDKELDIKIPQIKISAIKNVSISPIELMVLDYLFTE